MRDLSSVMDFECDWEEASNTIILKLTGENEAEIEKYIKKNIDKSFDINDYIVTERNTDIYIRLNINGVPANFGYYVRSIDSTTALMTIIGEKNPDFDMTRIPENTLSDEEAKKKAIIADGYDYEVDEQTIYHYFDMKDLVYKCEVETVYIDNGGSYFATTHTF